MTTHTSNGNQTQGQVYSKGNEYDYTEKNYSGIVLVILLVIASAVIFAVIHAQEIKVLIGK